MYRSRIEKMTAMMKRSLSCPLLASLALLLVSSTTDVCGTSGASAPTVPLGHQRRFLSGWSRTTKKKNDAGGGGGGEEREPPQSAAAAAVADPLPAKDAAAGTPKKSRKDESTTKREEGRSGTTEQIGESKADAEGEVGKPSRFWRTRRLLLGLKSSSEVTPEPIKVEVPVNATTKKERGWLSWSSTQRTKTEGPVVAEKTAGNATTAVETTETTSEEKRELQGNATSATEPSKGSEAAAVATKVSPQNATATNETAAPQQVTPSNVIVMGTTPGTPLRMYRRGQAAQQQQPPSFGGIVSPFPQQQPPGGGGGGRPPLSQNQLLLVEVLAAALGTAARVWMLTWLARRIAAEEESVQPTQHFAWERINDRYRRDESALRTAMRGPPPGISRAAWRRGRGRGLFKRTKSRADPANLYRRTVVVVEFGGGGGGLDPTKAAGGSGGMDLDYMSDVITFLLKQHRDQVFAGSSGRNGTGQPELEVVFLVNSPGGSVATYGLAAAQIQRLSGQEGITVTVCVDKYAASGGYMIASQADQLIAAPFASIGSVGVILEGLNFHELAKRYGVQPLVLKAGQSKNPLTTWGPVSRQDLEHEHERLEKVHAAFKEFVVRGRPALAGQNLREVLDGTVFLGEEALNLELVDRVMTSDEYILQRVEAGDRVLKLHRTHQSRFSRQIRLSPLDILPHLKTWIREASNIRPDQLVARLTQTGTFLSFLSHLVRRYWSP